MHAQANIGVGIAPGVTLDRTCQKPHDPLRPAASGRHPAQDSVGSGIVPVVTLARTCQNRMIRFAATTDRFA
jgi:hypothetical protein